MPVQPGLHPLRSSAPPVADNTAPSAPSLIEFENHPLYHPQQHHHQVPWNPQGLMPTTNGVFNGHQAPSPTTPHPHSNPGFPTHTGHPQSGSLATSSPPYPVSRSLPTSPKERMADEAALSQPVFPLEDLSQAGKRLGLVWNRDRACLANEREGHREILFNFRDLSQGVKSCKLVQGRVYRSACVSRGQVTSTDVRLILKFWRELGIRTVIDLRSKKEKKEDVHDRLIETEFPTVREQGVIGNLQRKRFFVSLLNTRLMIQGLVIPAPRQSKKKVVRAFLTPGSIAGHRESAMAAFSQEVLNPGGLTTFSILLVQYAQAEIVKVLRIISDKRNHPVLFHCTSGKDRTGLIAALVLALCGADDDEISITYSKSEQYLEPVSNLIKYENRYKGLDEGFDGTPRHVIEDTLEYIKQNWGSIPDYLDRIGFAYHEQRRLAAVLCRKDGKAKDCSPSSRRRALSGSAGSTNAPSMPSLPPVPPRPHLHPHAGASISTPAFPPTYFPSHHSVVSHESPAAFPNHHTMTGPPHPAIHTTNPLVPQVVVYPGAHGLMP